MQENILKLYKQLLKKGLSKDQLEIIERELDYYNRKFPLQGVRQILFIGGMEFQESLGAFVKELNLPVQFLSTAKLVDKSIPFSLNIL